MPPRASKWAIEQKLAEGETLGKEEEAAGESRRAFGDQRDIAAIERVSGNILTVDQQGKHGDAAAERESVLDRGARRHAAAGEWLPVRAQPHAGGGQRVAAGVGAGAGQRGAVCR
ncbi:hypothetical protein G6F63_015597 [Rhizopus arrhizus]|nr:hypothetical protein G6F63_015597 [Rhizopus arrhizus]